MVSKSNIKFHQTTCKPFAVGRYNVPDVSTSHVDCPVLVMMRVLLKGVGLSVVSICGSVANFAAIHVMLSRPLRQTFSPQVSKPKLTINKYPMEL